MSLTGKPQETEDTVIANDGFFPDLVLSDFLAPYRIPAEYDNAAVINAVVLGLVEVNLKLVAVKSAKITAGFTTLDDCLDAQDEPTINGDYQLMMLYRKAVFSWAKGWLLQTFNGMTRRPAQAANEASAMDTTDYWHDQSEAAVMTFLAAFGLQDSATTVRDPDQVHVALL